MTIYFEIIQLLFPKAILEIKDTALTTDSFAKYFTLPRNLELSMCKQTALSELHASVIGLSEMENDDTTKKTLEDIIEKCLATIYTKRHEKSHRGEGQTEPALRKLNSLIKDIYKELGTLEVMDKPHDNDPLNCFRYYIALFNAQVLLNAEYEGLLNRAGNNLNILKMRQITAEQMDLIKHSITECNEKISIIKPKIDNYNSVISEIVIDFITGLQRKNIDLCRHYDNYLTSFITPFFSSRSVSAIPLGGYYLGELLVKAVDEINQNSELTTGKAPLPNGRGSEL